MLLISIMLGLHLRVRHGYLVHLRSNGMRVRQGRATVSLVRRVRERRSEGTSLVMAMELRSHIRTTSGLIWCRSEAGAWRVGHLALITGLRVSATSAALVRVTTTTGASGTTGHVVAHVAMSRLGGFAAQVTGLGTRSQRTLGCRTHLSLVLRNRHQLFQRKEHAKQTSARLCDVPALSRCALTLASPDSPKLPKFTGFPCD